MNQAHPLGPYPSPEEREAELDTLAEAIRAEVITLGHSVEGRPIRAARVPRLSDSQDPARVLVTANIHGVEYVGTRVAMGFLAALLGPDPALEALRQRAEVWVLPSLNPDAYARTWARQGRGTLQELRANAHGVDLNRNFPLPGPQPWYALSLGGWATGSPQPGNPFYRGEAPLSEPETAALAKLLETVPFVASANLHSFMGTVFHAHVQSRPHFAAYGKLCRAFRSGQKTIRYRPVGSRMFDWFTGEQEDYQHHARDTWAICVEIFPFFASYRQHPRAPSTFWRFNPRSPESWVANDVPGLAAYFHATLDLGPPSRLDTGAR